MGNRSGSNCIVLLAGQNFEDSIHFFVSINFRLTKSVMSINNYLERANNIVIYLHKKVLSVSFASESAIIDTTIQRDDVTTFLQNVDEWQEITAL